MSDPTIGRDDFELVAVWEGPAEHGPWLRFEESLEKGVMSGELAMLDVAAWLAVTALAGVVGNAAYRASVPVAAAIWARAVGVLTTFRRRKGQTELDRLKTMVFEQMNQRRQEGKLTEEALRQRIDSLFAEIKG